jgi:selenide,water dikinase
MIALNDGAAHAALAAGVRCATDITGFGLLGHLSNILAGSNVGARIQFGRVPLLPGVLELAGGGCVPGGTRRNYESVQAEWAADLSEAERLVLVDAQTSGGLLLAVPPARLEFLLAALRNKATPVAAEIGEILPKPGLLRVVRS